MYQSRSEENGKQETKLKFIVERERVRQYNCVSLNCPIFATTTKEIYWRSSRDKESDIINLYFTILQIYMTVHYQKYFIRQSYIFLVLAQFSLQFQLKPLFKQTINIYRFGVFQNNDIVFLCSSQIHPYFYRKFLGPICFINK